MGTMGAMKAFAVGVARIATIIVVVIVALSVFGFGGNALWENWTKAQETARNAPLEALKTWPLITVEALGGVKLTLSTKWREGELLYQFNVDGYPPKIAAARDGNTVDSKWRLSFFDKDGFEVVVVNVPLSEMSRRTTTVVEGLSANTRTMMSADQYRRVATWGIGWSFP